MTLDEIIKSLDDALKTFEGLSGSEQRFAEFEKYIVEHYPETSGLNRLNDDFTKGAGLSRNVGDPLSSLRTSLNQLLDTENFQNDFPSAYNIVEKIKTNVDRQVLTAHSRLWSAINLAKDKATVKSLLQQLKEAMDQYFALPKKIDPNEKKLSPTKSFFDRTSFSLQPKPISMIPDPRDTTIAEQATRIAELEKELSQTKQEKQSAHDQAASLQKELTQLRDYLEGMKADGVYRP